MPSIHAPGMASAVIGAAGGIELAVEAGGLPLLTVALGVHRVAQHVVDRYAVRTGVEAFATSRAAIVAGDEPVVFLEQAHVPRRHLPARRVEVLVDLLVAAHRDHEAADVGVGER